MLFGIKLLNVNVIYYRWNTPLFLTDAISQCITATKTRSVIGNGFLDVKHDAIVGVNSRCGQLCPTVRRKIDAAKLLILLKAQLKSRFTRAQ